MAEEFDPVFGDKTSRETEDIIVQIAKLLLRAVEKEVRGTGERDKARGPGDDMDGVPKFIAKKLEAEPDIAMPLPEFADAPVFAGDEDAVERRAAGKAWDRKIRLWRRGLAPHPGAPKKEPRIPRGPKDIVGDDKPAEPGIPVAPDAPDAVELPVLPVEVPEFVIPDFPAIPGFGGSPVEDVDSKFALSWSYDASSFPSPPSAAVPVATAQAPPLPEFTPSATTIQRQDHGKSDAELEFDDVAEIIRQHRGPGDLPPLPRYQEGRRRQYGGSTAADLYGTKEHVEQQQTEQASTQSVIDAVVAAQADIANRRNRQDTATLEIMERTAYRQADHERRLREINAASQRSVSTLTDQYVL